METVLIVLTIVELVLLIGVLAAYLIFIARTLRNVSQTLGLITFGVRAIEKQTESIGPALHEVNGVLERAADELEQAAQQPRTPTA